MSVSVGWARTVAAAVLVQSAGGKSSEGPVCAIASCCGRKLKMWETGFSAAAGCRDHPANATKRVNEEGAG